MAADVWTDWHTFYGVMRKYVHNFVPEKSICYGYSVNYTFICMFMNALGINPQKVKKKLTLLLFVLLVSGPAAYAQRFAISNNLAFDMAGALSAGIEAPFSKKSSFAAYGSLRPWKRGTDHVHKHWIVEGQYRYYTCQVMNGFFFGPYAHGAQFNLAKSTLPFNLLSGLKSSRYEGWLLGCGFGVGYEYALAKHWNLGAEVGCGYTYIDYKRYECEVCGPEKDDNVNHYFGISKLALSIIYVF